MEEWDMLVKKVAELEDSLASEPKMEAGKREAQAGYGKKEQCTPLEHHRVPGFSETLWEMREVLQLERAWWKTKSN